MPTRNRREAPGAYKEAANDGLVVRALDRGAHSVRCGTGIGESRLKGDLCSALDNGAQVGYRSRQERGPENRGRRRKCGILDQAGTDAGRSRW